MRRIVDGSDDRSGVGPDAGSAADGRDRTEWTRSVAAGYDALADAYDEQRDPVAEVPLVESLASDVAAGSRILDAGCGGGRVVLETVSDRFETVGLDVSAAQLDVARGRVQAAALARGDIAQLPFADDSFDAVCSLHAIIHVPREYHERVFSEFARVTRPGGALLVAVGHGAWEGENGDWLDGGAAMRWSFHGAEENRKLVRQAGFRIDDETVVGDELGGGEWLYLRGTLEG